MFGTASEGMQSQMQEVAKSFEQVVRANSYTVFTFDKNVTSRKVASFLEPEHAKRVSCSLCQLGDTWVHSISLLRVVFFLQNVEQGVLNVHNLTSLLDPGENGTAIAEPVRSRPDGLLLHFKLFKLCSQLTSCFVPTYLFSPKISSTIVQLFDKIVVTGVSYFLTQNESLWDDIANLSALTGLNFAAGPRIAAQVPESSARYSLFQAFTSNHFLTPILCLICWDL